MKFTKMHGAGNDYIYINTFEEKADDPENLAIKLSDRHFGIGGDGIILIRPSDRADFMMDIYNIDGSRGKMCGNAIRCVAKYVYDNKMTDKKTISIDSRSGIKIIDVNTGEDGKVVSARVNMGSPVLTAKEVPVISENETAVMEDICVNGTYYKYTAVSMGNPHAVVFVDDADKFPVEEVGPYFERHEKFPDRINTEFCTVIDRKTIRMRVWERGSGLTLACGTGASAAAVAACVNGFTDENVKVILDGGSLDIFWDRENNTVFMTGPAETVFTGEIDV